MCISNMNSAYTGYYNAHTVMSVGLYFVRGRSFNMQENLLVYT
jgi:hypothetical protein